MQTALVTLGDARCGGNSTSDGFRGFRGLQCFSPRTTGPLKLVERKGMPRRIANAWVQPQSLGKSHAVAMLSALQFLTLSPQ